MDGQAVTGRHYVIGGGVAGRAAALLLVPDGDVPGDRITILEDRASPGGSLDGSGDAEAGFLTRGGRMFEPYSLCTFDLLAMVPAPDDPAISIRDDILAFNRAVPAWSECRLVRNGRKTADGQRPGLGVGEGVALNRLLLIAEERLEGRGIEEWFARAFFETNFWIMWSTMFSFQRWHSVAEMRRYMRRFLHLRPGLGRLAGLLRTRHNQNGSVVAPICA